MEVGREAVSRVLAVDDDNVLVRAWQREAQPDFEVVGVPDTASALEHASRVRPDLAIVDLRLASESGLDTVVALRGLDRELPIVLVSSFIAIDVAVAGMRAGANDVLMKPVGCRQIVARVLAGNFSASGRTPSLSRAEWEYINRVLHDHGGNITHTARALGIGRFSLQRKLRRTPPAE